MKTKTKNTDLGQNKTDFIGSYSTVYSWELNQTITWALKLSSSDCSIMETVNIRSPATDATTHFWSDGNNRLFRSSSMTNISLELNSETQRLETPGITAESLIKAHGEVNTAPRCGSLWIRGVETLMRVLHIPCRR